jgi:hypothetical protein
MSVLLEPANLEADAVVPQCLDNQYVSNDTYHHMLQTGENYDSPTVSLMREKEAKTEFVRSLVYSSQIIIQRAFLKNNAFLYNNYLPQDRQNVEAFAKLLRERAIIPFLFRESSLRDNLDFDLREEGGRALDALLQEVGNELACVRLAVSEEENERKTRTMSRDFSNKLLHLQTLQEPDILAMAAELSDCQRLISDSENLGKFKRSLRRLAAYTFEKAGELSEDDNFLSRNQVYADNFIVPGSSVALGAFKKPDQENPFVFELKKYVDLIYNTNLPDYLERYTLTPLGLPSRMALLDPTNNDFRPEKIEELLTDKEAMTSIRQVFMARVQKGMTLPLLNEMSVVDVAEVRSLPEWEAFKDAQTAILRDPLNYLNLLDQFQSDFGGFQSALSIWFNEKYKQKKTEEKYCSYVSLAISLAGKLIVVGADLMPLGGVLADFTAERIIENIPKKVKGYAAKLLINVYDIGKQQLDADRSYSIELMQTNEELTREYVVDLLGKIMRRSGEGIPAVYKQIADQGID